MWFTQVLPCEYNQYLGLQISNFNAFPPHLNFNDKVEKQNICGYPGNKVTTNSLQTSSWEWGSDEFPPPPPFFKGCLSLPQSFTCEIRKD